MYSIYVEGRKRENEGMTEGGITKEIRITKIRENWAPQDHFSCAPPLRTTRACIPLALKIFLVIDVAEVVTYLHSSASHRLC